MTTNRTHLDRIDFFAGEFSHSLDEKNRLAVPAAWRTGGGIDFMLVPAPTGAECLLGYPPAEFQSVSESVRNNPELSPRDRQSFLRLFNSKARHCQLDKQGRLLVPAAMAAEAGIESAAILVGNSKRFEIWQPERWRQKTDKEIETYQRVADVMGL